MDFVQIMHDWRRMCDKHTCSRSLKNRGLPICPIVADHIGYPCEEDPIDWTEEATKQFADIVYNWAKENPEPKQITWGELLKELGVMSGSLSTGFRFEYSAAVPEHVVKMLKAKEK